MRHKIEHKIDRIYISCDASVKYKKTAIGWVIRKFEQEPDTFALTLENCPDNNLAEFQAVYHALKDIDRYTCIINKELFVVTDSNVFVQTMACVEMRKNIHILEVYNKILSIVEILNTTYNATVKFFWRKRNSTKDLTTANDLAQALVGGKEYYHRIKCD